MKISQKRISELINKTKKTIRLLAFLSFSSIILNFVLHDIIDQRNSNRIQLQNFSDSFETIISNSKSYVVSYLQFGEPEYYNLYISDGLNKTDKLTNLLSMLPNILKADQAEIDVAKKAFEYANRLIEINENAISEFENGDFEAARKLIFSSEYISNENGFSIAISEFNTLLNNRMHEAVNSIKYAAIFSMILTLLFLLAIPAYLIYILRVIDKKIEPISILADSSDSISSSTLKELLLNNQNDEFSPIIQSLLSINLLVDELDFMSKRQSWGDIEYFINEDNFTGSFKVAVKSINSNMKDNVDMVFDFVNILSRIGEGDFRLDVPNYPGKKAVLSRSVENLIISLRDVNSAINRQVNSMITGRLSDRSDTSKFKGDWAKLLEGLNSVVDAVVAPINETIDVLDEVSKSNFNVQMQGNYQGDLELIKNSFNSTINSINEYINEIHMLASVIMTADVGILIKELDGTVIKWNKGATKLLGYTEADMIGKKVIITDDIEDQRIAEDDLLRLTRGEHIQYNDRRRKHKDGRIIHISGSFNSFYGADGKIAGVFSIFYDITDKLAIENELKKTQDDLVSILRLIPAPICAIGLETAEILECNAAFVAMCGLSGEAEIVGSKISRFFDFCQDYDAFHEDMAMLENMKNNEGFRFFVTNVDGTKIETEVFSKQLIFKEQAALAVYCVDLTEQRAHEQALRDAAGAAHDANKTKSQFLANMSHEIRTPMNGIIGLTELALDDAVISPKTADYLLKIKSSADGLLHIINDILDLSKIEAGELILEKIPFDLHAVFKECDIISSPKAEEKGLHLYFYNEPTLNRKLLGDPTKLRQSLLNFLSNSIKFTGKGIVSLMAKTEPITNDADKIKITFEIKDSGIGMTKEQVSKIFKPFKQADDSTTRKYGGTGLGLAITKNIIELMGGKVHVESIPSVGSKFSFSIVFDLSDEPSSVIGTQSNYHVPATKPMFKGRILVCEDNKTNQQVAQEHLEKIGFDVAIAENGKIGVNLVKEQMNSGNLFDIIFMDIHMPIMDGLEATTHLKKLNMPTPIIAMTANAMARDREKCIEAGMNDYISKPFKPQDLWNCVMKYITPINNPADFNMVNNEAEILTDNTFIESKDNTFVDLELGFERSAGSKKLYKKLLIEFIKEQPEIPLLLQQAVDSLDFSTARRIAHTAKSVAATIGAVRLSDILYEIENVYDSENPMHDNVSDLIHLYTTELENVINYLNTLELTKEERIETVSLPFDKQKALELISVLKPLLESGKSESQDYLDKIRASISPAGSFSGEASGITEKCKLLISQINDYDFDLSLETLKEIEEIIDKI